MIAVICLVGSTKAHGQLIVAHRGASHDAPENTLAAFRLAWERGADGVEGDFYLTRDNRIVCIHDSDTQRVAGKKLSVTKSSLKELRRLDVGQWKDPKWKGERIPTLEEVIELLPKDKVLFIELKMGPVIVAPLKEILDQCELTPEQYVIISFDEDTIAECEKLIPDVQTHWLAGHQQDEKSGDWSPKSENVILTMNRTDADGFGSQSSKEAFDAAFIQQLKKAGHGTFHVWTVDDIPMARFYQQQGAYGITTNRPGYIRAGLAEALAGEETEQ